MGDSNSKRDNENTGRRRDKSTFFRVSGLGCLGL